jgi:hypothetical protein
MLENVMDSIYPFFLESESLSGVGRELAKVVSVNPRGPMLHLNGVVPENKLKARKRQQKRNQRYENEQ